MTTGYIGQPISRVDGPAKVTGVAKYAAEHNVEGLVYGVVITSAIARGRIVRIDASAALALPGVLQVLTHQNTPELATSAESWHDEVSPPGSPFRPLQDDEIRFSAQPIALVVAETFEMARYAASLVHVEYDRAPHETDLEALRARAHEPEPREGIPEPASRGDARSAFASAAFRHEAEYRVPAEHHNPMEMFGTTAIRHEDGTLTVYDKTQGVMNVHRYLCKVFGIPEDRLRVLSQYVGGAFGLGLRPQYPVLLAVLAATELQRSVRVSLTRQQMWGLGHRPMTLQRVSLGASQDGTLESMIHEAISETSRYEDYTEPVVQWAGSLYRCDNVAVNHNVVPLNVCTPCDMRAPGASWGLFALESAMDELAVACGIDPLELRLKNYSDRDQNADKPYTSKALRACYLQAAERFGWARRDPRPGSMRNGHQRIGWGMATGIWDAMQQSADAKAVLTPDGLLTVCSAAGDIGTGTYTIMTQIAAEMIGLPIDRVTFQLRDSSLPNAPVEGGSFTAATVGTAVHAVCGKLREQLLSMARDFDGSPLAGATLADVTFADGHIRSRSDPSRAIALTDVLRDANLEAIVEEATGEPSPKLEGYARHTHTAVFAEVEVDAHFGTTRVTRVVSAIAAGRALNPKTAHSQIMGSIVWGIGMALQEESVIDQNFGRFMTHNLADYHFPVNADVHDIEVIFIEEHDDIINALGVKGMGEPGLVGVAAAIANAVYHATGKRIRSLPITPDKLM
ncbi:MAG: xanthine dehydrogenase family protein molybdopterin-binding subunit [Longimicrobiales bacterium]